MTSTIQLSCSVVQKWCCIGKVQTCERFTIKAPPLPVSIYSDVCDGIHGFFCFSQLLRYNTLEKCCTHSFFPYIQWHMVTFTLLKHLAIRSCMARCIILVVGLKTPEFKDQEMWSNAFVHIVYVTLLTVNIYTWLKI